MIDQNQHETVRKQSTIPLKETKQLQQIKLAASDRMKSMGELIYSIAHDQNHALTVVNNYLYGAIMRLEKSAYTPNDLLTMLNKIKEQTKKLTDITYRMKTFVAKGSFHYEMINLSDLINEVISFVNYEILEFPIMIQYESEQYFPAVKLDKLHIQQVILNLARNSIEAMKEAKIKNPTLQIETRLIAHHLIEVSVIDNGPGFDPLITHKMFEPYFTTKLNNTGLGLTVSRMIIEKHGGQLSSHLLSQKGACFKFTLPCISATHPLSMQKDWE